MHNKMLTQDHKKKDIWFHVKHNIYKNCVYIVVHSNKTGNK